MDEYDLTPDTSEEYDQLHSVQGLYNLPRGEQKGRHSYDYMPQYYIKHMEQESANRLRQPQIYGVDVGNKIIDYYVGQKHYTPEHAERIREAVEGKVHAQHISQFRPRVARIRKPRAQYEELAIA